MDKIDRILNKWDDADLRDLAKRLQKKLSRKPGRPEGSTSKNPATLASKTGAQYVRRLRNEYMKLHGVKLVPARVTDAALERAVLKYPAAKKKIMREHLRKQGKYRVRTSGK